MDYLFTLTDAGCCWRITMRDAAPPPSLYTFRPAVDGSARDSAGFESAIPRILPVFFHAPAFHKLVTVLVSMVQSGGEYNSISC
jgi:hypothetical protein